MPCRIQACALVCVCAAIGILPGCAEKAPLGGPAVVEESRDGADDAAPATVATSEPTSTPQAANPSEVAEADSAAPPALEVPTEPEVAQEKPTQATAQPPAALPASEAPLPFDSVETANLKMPEVVLTEQHAALCKVRVGDQFPNLELPNLEGEKHSLTELFGPKLTLVVFWNARQSTGLEELSDLNRYHLPRFGDKGLAVVAINTGDQTQLASELATNSGASYPVLSDADGAALQQVASGKLPRTYLLDPAGKVLWFDLEYSPTTRRDLASAIRVSLGQ
jgi:peroxiredoxin